ncbi:vascular endothelial growth factor receptor 1-like isoform X3 [Daphnia pulicaria]|uniref:vascular endothelial growth factor receptor 1-like isoform X3 n=1 Tax=Daphnia pulicaria TaxID=35523 RepID=UPI001EEBA29E|nr:vascular endothelial growth factor receptor 1-like isoform X3 [Daphnia pulicaria]
MTRAFMNVKGESNHGIDTFMSSVGNEDFDLTGPQNFSSNKLEAKTSIFDPVTFLEEEKHEINVPTLTTTLIGLCAFSVGIFGIKIHLNKRKVKRQLEKMLNGDPSRIDPEVPLEYQTEFLPYDRKWEFPRKRLRLGQELGSGCFGRVVKGEAVGIKDSDETVTTVAVKMTKLTAKSHNALDVLIKELKMMIHLWEHLNIVNLMGACTNTNIKEEILVIIEFCKFGDLKSYLIKHRDQFINELNALGNMPPTNETATNDVTQHPSVAMKLVNEISELQTHEPAHVTEMPERDQTYKSRKDSDANFTQIIKTSDLISWSYQIARGMEFLASKKVLHGDLAARNVLLADHGVVKVADFGMARQMKDYECEKEGEELFPVQWMAIESLTINIFSSQSDVWSYGILLWEIFSLGNVPYPGMENGWILVREIQNGCRMEKPEYSPNFLGEIMKNCWQKNPNERPTFSQLAGVIEKQIEALGSLDYLNMNSPANEVGQTDEMKVHSNSNKSLENC